LDRSKTETARQLFESAKVLLSQSKAVEAAAKLREADALEPDRFEISALLGVALAVQRQYDDAIKSFQKSIKLNPKDAESHASLCRALSETNRRSGAIEECRMAVDLSPDKGRYRAQLASLYLLDERSDEALQALGNLYSRTQDNIVYLGTLGDAYYMNGDYGRAAEIYEQIAAKWPNVNLTYLRLAGVYDFLDKGELAIKASRTFAERERKSFLAQFSLGLSLGSFGFFEEAIEPLTAAKALSPDVGEVYLELSEIYEILGMKDDLLANLKFAYQNLPPDAVLAFRYGKALSDYGNIADSVVALERANEMSPETPQVMFMLGSAYIAARPEKVDKGIELVERSLAMSPLPSNFKVDLTYVKNRNERLVRFDEYMATVAKNPNDLKARSGLAECYLFRGEIGEAEKQYVEITRLAPSDQNYNGLGIFYYQNGLFEKALDAFKKATELNPHHILFLTLSNTYSKLGRIDEAIDAAKRSVEIKPTSLECRIELGDLFMKKAQRENALREYQAAFDASSTDIRPNLKLAWLYIKMGNKESAFRHYVLLKSIAPDRLKYLELSLRAHFGRLP